MGWWGGGGSKRKTFFRQQRPAIPETRGSKPVVLRRSCLGIPDNVLRLPLNQCPASSNSFGRLKSSDPPPSPSSGSDTHSFVCPYLPTTACAPLGPDRFFTTPFPDTPPHSPCPPVYTIANMHSVPLLPYPCSCDAVSAHFRSSPCISWNLIDSLAVEAFQMTWIIPANSNVVTWGGQERRGNCFGGGI